MQIEWLGPYRIIREIGKGGMGSVYEAVADAPGAPLGKKVAVKALNPVLASADGFRERFQAEIESLKALDHEGIVKLFGDGEQDGIVFYSMELVDGTNLEYELNAGRRFDWRETLQIGIQVCRALKHAHDHGVIHRDIKPANLILTKDQRVKMADFGIVRWWFAESQLTTAGGILGTADYMSPEQADGRPLNEKCDQYSLGGVMYALLAGRPPFRAKTMPEMLQLQRFADPEPVGRYAPDVPEQLERLIMQLLAKEPEDRFPNVLVLARHMEAMEKALSRPVKPTADDFDPATAAPVKPNQVDGTMQLDDAATRPAIPSQDEGEETRPPDLYDAPTLDQPEERGEGPSAEKMSAPLSTASPAKGRVDRFTTVDEEAARKRQQSRGSRLVMFTQLSVLLAALGALMWGGWYLMRPSSANELYQAITTTIEAEGDDDLRVVADELADFFRRFPDDPRTGELDEYRGRLEFQKYERQARLRARIGASGALKPIEQIYFQAIAIAQDDPAQAIANLRAMLALYDPTDKTRGAPDRPGAGGEALSEQRLLLAARQQVEKLSQRLQAEAADQVPALRERMAVAAKLRQTEPGRARRMYQAIVKLYGSQLWAKEVVDEARAALKELSTSKL